MLIGGRLTVRGSAVRHEWIRADNWYYRRVANPRNGTGRNDSARLTSATVLNDGSADRLTGGTSMD